MPLSLGLKMMLFKQGCLNMLEQPFGPPKLFEDLDVPQACFLAVTNPRALWYKVTLVPAEASKCLGT